MSRADVERFRVGVEAQLGIVFDARKHGLLAGVLGRRAGAYGLSAAAYVAQLVASPGFDEGALAAELTVGETYFFRNREQFAALVDIARTTGPLDILSAGCASGEEPYSIAMALRDAQLAPATIRAFDINPEALARAARARYAMWSLRETPDAIRDRWFVQVGKHVELVGEIRNAVQLDRANLLDEAAWPTASLDVVFCRNVLMYFRPEVMATVIRAIARALRPGGHLFLGHAETLRGISDEFELCHAHDTFFYVRRPAGWTSSQRRAVADVPPIDWLGSIRDATDRVSALTRRDSPPPLDAEPDAGGLLELWRQERFGDVLAAIEQRGGDDPEVAVMRAAACAQCGRIEDAERACEQLIAGRTAPAAGHFILALCCEAAGDVSGAVEHQRVAIGLDPGFALAHMRLGVLARRRNDRALATRELGEAAVLLDDEDERRIILFGGGFQRDALIALCRSELASLERTS